MINKYLKAFALGLAALCVSCGERDEEQQVSIPKVETGEITEVTTTAVASSCQILNDGGGTITACGLVYGTAANPTLETAKYTNEISSGGRTSIERIEGLERNQKYYLRAYATNAAGTGYGAVREVTLRTSVDGIALSATELNLHIGASYTLAVTFTPMSPHDTRVLFESDQREIASVDERGVITAHRVGQAIITATSVDGKHTVTCTIRVRKRVEGISLAERELSLVEGRTHQLVYTVTPEDADDSGLVFTSGSPSIATVSSTGLITAVSEGQTSVYVSLPDGSHRTSCTVRVTPSHIKVTSLTIAPTAMTLAVGQTGELTASILPETASDKVVTYTSSKPDVASVHPTTGRVTAHKIGSATITATSRSEGKTATCAITVQSDVVQVRSISIHSKPAELYVGEPWLIEYTIAPSNASNKQVEITSSDPAVAEVGTFSGKPVIWGRGAGTCTITVKSLDGSNVTSSTSLTILKRAPELRGIEIPSRLELKVGEKYTFRPKLIPEDAVANPGDILWGSTNTDVATIDNITGEVTALAPGFTQINASIVTQHGQRFKACYLEVKAAAEESSEAYKEIAADLAVVEQDLKRINDAAEAIKSSGKSKEAKAAEARVLLEDDLDFPVIGRINDVADKIQSKRANLSADERTRVDARKQKIFAEYDRLKALLEDIIYA